MLAEAMAETDAALGELAQPHLTRWAEEIETNAARHPGIKKS